ncbi:MAG: hypothetical protein JXR96_19285 [Deltaproteobacteria bacterium]|nr:hypothetical protein [Deltaproteobacteria bacterium]
MTAVRPVLKRSLPWTALGGQGPIVAVFDIEVHRIRLGAEARRALADYLSGTKAVQLE